VFSESPRRGARASAGILALLLLSARSGTTAPDAFVGVIGDTECSGGRHANMRMGPTDAECTNACVDAHGASYVLWDGTRGYMLSDQRAPKAFAGRKVRVQGALDPSGKTIHVEGITEEK
jgi:hypothetical protein